MGFLRNLFGMGQGNEGLEWDRLIESGIRNFRDTYRRDIHDLLERWVYELRHLARDKYFENKYEAIKKRKKTQYELCGKKIIEAAEWILKKRPPSNMVKVDADAIKYITEIRDLAGRMIESLENADSKSNQKITPQDAAKQMMRLLVWIRRKLRKQDLW